MASNLHHALLAEPLDGQQPGNDWSGFDRRTVRLGIRVALARDDDFRLLEKTQIDYDDLS